MNQPITKQEQGATALFVVLFATILFSVITIGFLSLMISDQRRATDSEWSEGAYDSALAGVEDGKRVLAICQSDPSSNACLAIANESCDTIAQADLVNETDSEVLIQSNDGAGGSVNQAYTCVIVRRDTPDYRGDLGRDESVVIPLDSGGEKYSQVTLSWFISDDSPGDPTFGSSLSETSLPAFGTTEWPATRPPIIRTQFMQYDRGDIKLDDFDKSGYAHTVFLYPSLVGAASGIALAGDDLRNPGDLEESSDKDSPKRVVCSVTFPTFGGYVCEVDIDLPDIPKTPAVAPEDRMALLRMSAIYGRASYQVQMKNNSGEVVNFVDIQPSIDSTGRAGDVFRRVDARVDMTGAISNAYPRATIDVTEKLCKDFSIGAADSNWQCS